METKRRRKVHVGKQLKYKNTSRKQVLLIKNNNEGDEVTLSHFPSNYCERGERQTEVKDVA